MGGLANFGYFAGGMATGIQAGSKLAREHEEEKRRREDHEYKVQERDREKKIRAAVGGRLGRVGQEETDWTPNSGYDNPTTSTYTEDQAWRDAAGDVGRLGGDPLVAAQYRQTGMNLRRGQRQETQENMADQILQLRRRLAAGEDHLAVYGEAARLYGQVPDGKNASLTDLDGTPHLVLTDTNAGQSRLFPATPETVNQALDQLYMMTSPQAYQQGRTLGIQQGQLDVQRRNADTLGQYRGDQSRLINAQVDRLRRGPQATPLNAAQAYALKQQKGFDTERERIMEQLDLGDIDEAEANRRINRLSIRFGQQMRPEQQPRAGSKALGDGIIERPDGSLVQAGPDGVLRPLRTQQDTRQLGATIVQNLPPRGQVGGAPGEAGAGGGLRPRPQSRDHSRYGALTPWSTIEQQVRAGDPAAIQYARERLSGGPGMVGVNPPESLVRYMQQLEQENSFAD